MHFLTDNVNLGWLQKRLRGMVVQKPIAPFGNRTRNPRIQKPLENGEA